MKKVVSLMLLIALIQGCNFASEVKTTFENANEPVIWAFIQFNVPEEGSKIDSYYYFAEVSQPLFDKIKTNKVTRGFFYLQNVRYWGSDDVIYEYRDKENKGDLVFRIEDIRMMKQVNSAPIIGQGIEQYNEEEAQALQERQPANALD